MNLFDMALEALPEETEATTYEQRIARANVLAILAVDQELSRLITGESRFSAAVVDAARKVAPLLEGQSLDYPA